MRDTSCVREAFERFIGIDWSGATGQSDQQIYLAEARRLGARITVSSVARARDRTAVEDFLLGSALEPAPGWEAWSRPEPIDRRSRRLVALDFAFGFPAGFRHPDVHAAWTWDHLGRWASDLVPSDGAGHDPIRDAIAASPGLAGQFRMKAGDRVPDQPLRQTDLSVEGRRPESVFHLVGPSQVGLGSIAGIGMLHRLRGSPGLAVWPLDPPERIAAAHAVLVECWPRMWLGPSVSKNELPQRVAQMAAWGREGVVFRTQAEQAALSSGHALDAVAAAVGAARVADRLPDPRALPEESRTREGWIAGVPVP